MKNLYAKIYRQRLIIEGIYTTKVTGPKLKTYLKDLSDHLEMTIIYGPIVKNLAGKVNSFHDGLESVLIWAESGVSTYVWDKQKFFTVDIYSCKKFSVKKAVNFSKKFFKAKKIVSKSV